MPSRKPTEPKPRKSTFSNGLRLVSENHPHVHGVSLSVWIKTGTRYEKPEESGVSHFLEHMLFKGTKKRDALDIVRQIEDVGGDFNAFTSQEFTCLEVGVLSKDLDRAAEILCDCLLNSKFDSREIEKERRVILQEIAMVEDDPEEFAYDCFYDRAFPGSRLGKPILGTKSSLGRMTRRTIKGYFEKNYAPTNAVIAASGRVSHKRLEKAFAPLKKRSWFGSKKALSDMGTVKKFGEGIHWIDRDYEQAHLVLGYQVGSVSSEDRFALGVLNTLLGSGMSSRLFQEIREKNGLAYNTYSYLATFEDTGILSFYAAASSNKVKQCLELIRTILDDISRNGVSKKALESAKGNLIGTLLISADDMDYRMGHLARNELYGHSQTSVSALEKEVRAVTSKDIQSVVQRYLEQKPLMVGLGNTPKGISKLGPLLGL